jgi:hypothetical protein
MSALKALFLLDPDVVFLNHGSFGACPLPVFETYQTWQRELERQPTKSSIFPTSSVTSSPPQPVSVSTP